MRSAVVRLCPLTGRGALLAALSLLAVTHWGRGRADLVAAVLGLSGLGLVVLCGIASSAGVALAAAALRRARTARGLVLECGVERDTGLEPTGPGALPLVEWSWRWRRPRGVACSIHARRGRLHERARPTLRFAAERIERQLEVGDVLGLWRFQPRCVEPVELIALPDPGALRGVPWPAVLQPGDGLPDPDARPCGEPLELRAWAPGDPARRILWRSWARARRLDVRVAERSLEAARCAHAYLIAGPGDEPAAAAARVALESGALGPRWRFGADGAPASSRPAQALQAIARSAAHEGACELEAFAGGSAVDAGLIVFAPARPGDWTGCVRRLARARPGALCVIAVVDAAGDDDTLRRERETLGPLLPGVDLWLVSRTTGRRLGPDRAARSAA